MYIYLDESYNLKDRTKLQFVSINGFTVLNEKGLFKRWKECRLPFLGKRRIHATDSNFDGLKQKTLNLIGRPDVTLLSTFQIVQEISFEKDKKYFLKGKLNFEKLYSDLLRVLFSRLKLDEYREIKIIVDSRKYKGGFLAQTVLRVEIEKTLKEKYPVTKIEFKIMSSSTDILLEFADFISNIFYRAYIKNDEKFFKDLKFKLIQIKNPLK